MKELLEYLAMPFPDEEIKTRQQAGIELQYAERQTIANRLDDAIREGLCSGWESNFMFGPNGEIVCAIGITIKRDKEYVTYWRSDGAEQTKIESVKGGLTDAFKRAADMWGVARYLREGELPHSADAKKKPTKQAAKQYEKDKSLNNQYFEATTALGWTTDDRSKHIAAHGGDIEAALEELS